MAGGSGFWGRRDFVLFSGVVLLGVLVSTGVDLVSSLYVRSMNSPFSFLIPNFPNSLG